MYLVKNDYIDDLDQISISFTQAKDDGELAPFPESLNDIETEVLRLIGGLYANAALPHIEDGRKGKVLELNSNFDKKEFQELWARINHKAIYRVDFDSEELTAHAIDAINRELHVSPLQYTVQTGAQKSKISDEQMQHGDTFSSSSIRIETHSQALSTGVKYDLLGNLSSGTQLKRTTIVKILTGIKPEVFAKYRINPENFMAEAGRLINEQKASMVVEHINYDPINEKFDSAIFTASQLKVDLTKAGQKLKNHIYDYALTDSEGERNFASQLDQSLDVEVFAKLPKGFSIPTPVGDYNPDWAIAFKDGAVKHIYFVAETKGSMSSMQLRHVEQSKIECAKKFFEEINTMYAPREIKYGVVSTFGKLMEIVSS
jgi:type III restriction enzyme